MQNITIFFFYKKKTSLTSKKPKHKMCLGFESPTQHNIKKMQNMLIAPSKFYTTRHMHKLVNDMCKLVKEKRKKFHT